MSAPLGAVPAARPQRSGAPRPPLRLLAQPPGHRPRLPFVALIVLTLGLGLVGLLVVNTSLEQGAFTAAVLQARADRLADREQVLTRRVATQRAPQALAREAAALGMVPTTTPAFLHLPSGRILGRARPVAAVGSPKSPPAVRDPDAGELGAQRRVPGVPR